MFQQKSRRETKTPSNDYIWTYLSGKHKQCDEEDKERDGAHCLQIFKKSWSWMPKTAAGMVRDQGNNMSRKDTRKDGEW